MPQNTPLVQAPPLHHPAAPYVCAVVPSAGSRLRRAANRLGAAELRCHRHETVDGDLLIVQLGGPGQEAERVAGYLHGVPCGLSPAVQGLGRVPYAARLAAQAARALPPDADRPRLLDDLWLEVFAVHLPEISADLVARVLAPLDEVATAESERLVRTVRTHLDGTGAIADTAAALYCHRNTVQSRLNRFGEITGRDVRVPYDAAVVALALRAPR